MSQIPTTPAAVEASEVVVAAVLFWLSTKPCKSTPEEIDTVVTPVDWTCLCFQYDTDQVRPPSVPSPPTLAGVQPCFPLSPTNPTWAPSRRQWRRAPANAGR